MRVSRYVEMGSIISVATAADDPYYNSGRYTYRRTWPLFPCTHCFGTSNWLDLHEFHFRSFNYTCHERGRVSEANSKSAGTHCPYIGSLIFNKTNAAEQAPCTGLNYDWTTTTLTAGRNDTELREYNSTTGPAPENCAPFSSYDMIMQIDLNGSITIPGIVHVGQALFQGKWPRLGQLSTVMPLNLTDIDLPDLVNVTRGDLRIEWAPKVQSLKVPKLTNVEGQININMFDTIPNPPPMSLSFPSLRSASKGLFIYGNIDT